MRSNADCHLEVYKAISKAQRKSGKSRCHNLPVPRKGSIDLVPTQLHCVKEICNSDIFSYIYR